MSQAKPGPWTLGAAALAVLLGLALPQFMAELPPPQPWLCAGLAALLLGVLVGRAHGAAWLLLLPALFALALSWAGARAGWRLEARLPAAWEGRELQLDAEVIELPQRLRGQGGATLWRLMLRPLGPARDATASTATAIVMPAALSLWFDAEDGPLPAAGELWRLQVRLRRVHGLQNPGMPDSELWLLERGIGAQGQLRSARRLAAAPPWSLQALRQGLRDRLQRALPDAQQTRAREVLAGLLLGDQAAMSGGVG